MIGQRDRTAIGRDLASPELAEHLGNYPDLGKRAARLIRNSRLVEFDDLGHSPQVEAPERFNAALLEALEYQRQRRMGRAQRNPSPAVPEATGVTTSMATQEG